MILPQIEVSNDPGERAVRKGPAVFAFEDFLDSDPIAFGVSEDLPEDRE